MNNTGFVAGTLIHTDKGLVPIQELKVGDRVLSKPEWSTEESYKTVITTFCSHEKKVYFLHYFDNFIEPDPDEFFSHGMSLPEFDNSKVNIEIMTENHLIWVIENEYEEIPAGWYSSDEMAGYQQLILQGGNEIGGIAFFDVLFKTNVKNVFYATNRAHCPIFIIDLRDQMIEIYYVLHLVADVYKKIFNPNEHMSYASNIIIGDLNKHEILNEVIDFVYMNSDKYEVKTTATSKVFNLEVADNHTYYIGKKGLWVHDATENSQKQ